MARGTYVKTRRIGFKWGVALRAAICEGRIVEFASRTFHCAYPLKITSRLSQPLNQVSNRLFKMSPCAGEGVPTRDPSRKPAPKILNLGRVPSQDSDSRPLHRHLPMLRVGAQPSFAEAQVFSEVFGSSRRLHG